jgi:hypothetical protein
MPAHDSRRVPDPELAIPNDYESVFDSSPSTSAPSRLGSPIHIHSHRVRENDRGQALRFSRASSPQPSIDSLDTTTLGSVLAAAEVIARAAFHLLTFTAGLYLASSTFTVLEPLLDESWIWAPTVFMACVLVTMMAPFWGLLALHIFSPPRVEFDDHTRHCLTSIGVGIGLAALRVLVVLGTLVHTSLPCHDATLACAAQTAVAVGRAMVDAWDSPEIATSVALTLVPLAAAWWYTARKAGLTTAGYVITALKAAAVTLALLNVWLVLAVGHANELLKGELEKCRDPEVTRGQLVNSR